MTLPANSEDSRLLRSLFPFQTLPRKVFDDICQILDGGTAEPGEVLFERGEATPDLFYLLTGEVALQGLKQTLEVIAAGTDSGRFAIAHQIPRKVDAVARTQVRFVRVPLELLEHAFTTDHQEELDSMVTEQNNHADWMTELLKSPVLQKLPPADLQKLLMSFQDIEIEKEAVIIQQDDPGDYFYIIKSGQCLLTRQPSKHAKAVKLGLIRDGEMFGEDALLSGAPRNVTVSALTKVELLRLDETKFNELIANVALTFINPEQLRVLVEDGATVLDVRAVEAYARNAYPGSINYPFFTLRMQYKQLNRSKPVVVVCEDGKTSAAAAFFLLKHFFDVSILRGGLNSLPDYAQGAPEKVVPDDVGSDSQHDENATLRAENQQLAQQLATAQARYEELEKKYRHLLQHAEKMKALLVRKQ
ncbi:MAG: cyclic nucleotide-binding domain-containing protein [Methylococcales bacterium]|nr:cyclic nucleotide-binding domain-containing protein [Methylococcales bacterium]